MMSRRSVVGVELRRRSTRVTGLATALAAIACLLALTSAEAAFGPLGQDQRISFMGPNGNTDYDAFDPSVAYNPAADEYFVVWSGDDNTPPLVEGESEIFAQRVSGSGAPLGERIRVSTQGADGDRATDAGEPRVAYNPAANEYLVVWRGEIGATNDDEIFGQRLTAAGVRTGANGFRISHMGPDGDASYRADDPSVTYNSAANEYLVVWSGDDNTLPLLDRQFEIFGQRLTAAGGETGTNDFSMSDMGPSGDESYGAFDPSVASNPATGEYLVVWEGDDNTAPLVDGESEIFGQRLNPAGVETGTNDFRVSDMGPDGSSSFDAGPPNVAPNPATGEYLVVWHGDDDTAPLVDDESEIFGRWLGVLAPLLVATDPPSRANDNNPRLKGSVDPDATVDVFTNANCSGTPAVNDARGAELNGAGIAVPVADNTTTPFSATASSDGRTSRCSNSIAYTELTPARDTTAPVVSSFAVSPTAFRPAAVASPRGSSFRFRLSEQAAVRIVIKRALPGRRLGRRCVSSARKLRTSARCMRFKRAGTLSFRSRAAGGNRIAFRGRIGRRALALGRYRATIVATDPAGNRSRPRRASFSVVRR